MKNREDIEKRYEQFRCLELPGQPMMAHMGTNYLINDLHKALVETEAGRDRLRTALGKLRRKHYLCGDSYYSCPKVGLDYEGESCTNEWAGDECDCGADEYNAIIDAALQEAGDE